MSSPELSFDGNKSNHSADYVNLGSGSSGPLASPQGGGVGGSQSINHLDAPEDIPIKPRSTPRENPAQNANASNPPKNNNNDKQQKEKKKIKEKQSTASQQHRTYQDDDGDEIKIPNEIELSSIGTNSEGSKANSTNQDDHLDGNNNNNDYDDGFIPIKPKTNATSSSMSMGSTRSDVPLLNNSGAVDVTTNNNTTLSSSSMTITRTPRVVIPLLGDDDDDADSNCDVSSSSREPLNAATNHEKKDNNNPTTTTNNKKSSQGNDKDDDDDLIVINATTSSPTDGPTEVSPTTTNDKHNNDNNNKNNPSQPTWQQRAATFVPTAPPADVGDGPIPDVPPQKPERSWASFKTGVFNILAPPVEDDEQDGPRDQTFKNIEDMTLDELIDADVVHLQRFSKLSRKDAVLWRLVLCSICVLMVWVTSGLVLNTLLDYAIAQPSFGEVVDSWSRTVNAGTNEISITNACTTAQYNSCRDEVEAGALQFHAVLQSRFDLLEAGAVASSNIYDRCDVRYQTTLQALQTHYALGGPVFFREDRCSEDQIDALKALIGIDHTPKMLKDLKHLLNNNSYQWYDRFTNFTDSVEARIAYDRAYFLNASVNFGRTLDLNLDELRLALSEIDFIALNFRYDLRRWLDPTIFNKYTSSLGDIATEWVRDVVGVWNRAKKGIHDAGFPDMSFALFPIDFINFSDEFSALPEHVRDLMTMGVRKLVNEVELKLNSLNNTLYDAIDKVTLLSHFRLDFPNPNWPRPNADRFFSLFDAHLTKMDQLFERMLLSAVGAKADLKELVLEQLDIHSEAIKNAIDRISLPTIDIERWKLFRNGKPWEPIFDMFSKIMIVFTILDIFYRVTNTLKTVFFYFKTTQSLLPQLDLRKDSDHNVAIDFVAKLPFGMFSQLATVLLFLIFFIAVVFYLILQYLTLYGTYVANCVHGDDGTFVAKTTNTIGFNMIKDTTRFYRAGRSQEYAQYAWGRCEEETHNINDKYQRYVNLYQLDKNLYNTASHDMMMFGQCIEPTLTFTNINPIRQDTQEMLQGQYLWVYEPFNGTKARNQTNQNSQPSPFAIQNSLPVVTKEKKKNKNKSNALSNSWNDDLTLQESPTPFAELNFKNYFDLQQDDGDEGPPEVDSDAATVNTTKVETQYVNWTYITSANLAQCDQTSLFRYPWDGFHQAYQFDDVATFCQQYIPPVCEGIEFCQPSAFIIQKATRNSSCDAEWYVHAFLIKLSLFVLILVMMNIARILLMMFFTTYFFDRLGTKVIEILEYYRITADPIRSTVSDEDRKKEIRSAIDGAKMKAVIYLVGSVLCHVPWIVALLMLNQNIVPRQV